MRDFAGDAGSQLRQHERGHVAHVVDGDVAAQRGLGFHELQDGREILDAAGSQRLDGAGRNAIGADAARAQRRGQVSVNTDALRPSISGRAALAMAAQL
ncbi:hypothetical protein G6F68_017618 [Rhizopus microsporus]|nr:hypothetical protein G6F68_017618 [Rhizopus microsporus]